MGAGAAVVRADWLALDSMRVAPTESLVNSVKWKYKYRFHPIPNSFYSLYENYQEKPPGIFFKDLSPHLH
jgi:hypothetical protein